MIEAEKFIMMGAHEKCQCRVQLLMYLTPLLFRNVFMFKYICLTDFSTKWIVFPLSLPSSLPLFLPSPFYKSKGTIELDIYFLLRI